MVCGVGLRVDIAGSWIRNSRDSGSSLGFRVWLLQSRWRLWWWPTTLV